MKDYAIYYHKDIVEILDMIKRELLLILKTNNYLRAIDKRLGNPTNTYNTINNATWRVFTKEMIHDSQWEYYGECFRYYFIKLMFSMNLLKIKMMGMFGVKASLEEMKDFDLDYNE